MLRLGNIVYANVYPVHAGLLNATPLPFRVVEGIPTELNRSLAEGKVDVAPSSSIEYAVNAGRYRILPGLSITSRVRAMSVALESRFPLAELDGKRVALTTASATSVVLLRIILELFHGIGPEYLLYAQGAEEPYERADAVLTIGDLALRRTSNPVLPKVFDLGEVWNAQTGLPFVFALWQVNYRKGIDQDLALLLRLLEESKRDGLSRLEELAQAGSAKFNIRPDDLVRYWKTFSYDLGPEEQKGLLTYYGHAAELGVIDSVPELRLWRPEPS
jgi:chorismate dehydratase